MIDEKSRLKLLNDVKNVRKSVDELKRDLAKMKYYEIELETGERKTVREDEIQIVDDPKIIHRFYKNARIR